MQPAVKQFLNQFLTTPKGNSEKSIQEKIKFWVFAANHTEKVYPNADSAELVRRRRNARNNVRRLAQKYSPLLAAVSNELENEQ